MTKFWCNGKNGFCLHHNVQDCVCCKYQDGTGGVNIPDDSSLANADEICALRDQVENLTLYLTEIFALNRPMEVVISDRHPGLPGYAPKNGGRILA